MRSRRPGVAAILVACCLVVCQAVAAGPATPGPPEFEPATFVPGDVVTLYSRLEAGAATWRVETVSSGFVEPPGREPQILSAAIEKRSGAPLLVVRFVPWRPGTGQLPELTVGGLEIPRIRFECGSALSGGDSSPPRPMPQLDPPGLYARLYAIGGAFIVAVLAAVIAVTKAVPWLRSMLWRWSFAAARRDLDDMLARLAGGAGGPDAWAELCSGLRRFVGLRSLADWMPLTPSEISLLPGDATPGGVGQDAAILLSMGDEARFAGGPGLDIRAGVETARSIADRLDAACDPRSRAKATP
jgi:hypothetical protein